jgi:hypothetical protein
MIIKEIIEQHQLEKYSIDELERILPLSFQNHYVGTCDSCLNHSVKETITYERYIIINRGTYNHGKYESRLYRIIYKPRYYKRFKNPPPDIGESTGSIGWQLSLEGALIEAYTRLRNWEIEKGA